MKITGIFLLRGGYFGYFFYKYTLCGQLIDGPTFRWYHRAWSLFINSPALVPGGQWIIIYPLGDFVTDSLVKDVRNLLVVITLVGHHNWTIDVTKCWFTRTYQTRHFDLSMESHLGISVHSKRSPSTASVVIEMGVVRGPSSDYYFCQEGEQEDSWPAHLGPQIRGATRVARQETKFCFSSLNSFESGVRVRINSPGDDSPKDTHPPETRGERLEWVHSPFDVVTLLVLIEWVGGTNQ